MFFPEAMTELELIVPEKDLLAVTNILTGQGIFHQVDASNLSARTTHTSTESWKEHASEYAMLERRTMALMQTLSVEDGTPPAGKQTTMVPLETIRPAVDKIEQAVKEATGELSANQKAVAQLMTQVGELQPVADINIDISVLRNPKHIHSIFGTIPTANIERLETSLSRTPFVLLPLREEGKNSVVWLTGSQNNSDILDRAARSAYLNPFEFTSVHDGTPAEIIKTLNADIEKANAYIEKQKVVTAELKKTYGNQLQGLLWEIRTSRMLADAMSHYGKLKFTYLIVGWIPSAALEKLTAQLKQASKNIIIDSTPFKRGDSSQNVPVSLKNPGIMGAFQTLVTTYARPRYEEIDPTILITITYPLLFGAMFGDVGHGILLFLFGLLITSKKVPALRAMGSLGVVITLCGVMATIFGFLYGSIFGFEEVLHPLWMAPINNINTTLVIAVGVGVVLLSIGYLLNIINAFLSRDFGSVLFSHTGIVALLLYWSILALVLSFVITPFPVPQAVLYVLIGIGAILMLFSEIFKHLVDGHRPLIHGGVGLYLFQAVVELFEKLIGFMSNTLSYIRVGAFAVAHAGLSGAIFVLAGQPGTVGYWITIVLGNLFIVGFEGLIVGIQTLRLEYYEFLGKFFKGGGMPYEPLAPLKTQEK